MVPVNWQSLFGCNLYVTMIDFTLSITKESSGFIVTTSSGEQVPLELPALPSLSGNEAGHWLYQWLFSGPILARYQACVPDRLLLSVPGELLDWPWQRLHDGVWPLALRHSIVLLPAERQQSPALVLEDGPLRVLLTLAPDEEHAALEAAIGQMIDQLEQRHADRVRVSKVNLRRGPRHLQEVFHQALEPFHLWHHVGPCGPGLTLRLKDAALGAHQLNYLLESLPGLRCFVLSTHGSAPAASAYSQLKAPFLLCQAASPAATSDLWLLQGFYDRLLTHDLAVAATLAQLTAYLAPTPAAGWTELTMLARTPHLYLGAPQPVRPLLPGPEPGPPSVVPVAPVSILFLKANPQGATQIQDGLRIDQEIKEVRSALRENHQDAGLRVEVAVHTEDISPYLLRHLPELLHFSGHATDDGALVLEKGVAAEADFIEFPDIARLLAEYSETLHCVVLNACYSEPLAEAICQRIACAIGMRGPINDGLAIRFSEIFYGALSCGDSVGLAFRKARNDVLSNSNARAEMFQIKSRFGVNPDELFFVTSGGGQR